MELLGKEIFWGCAAIVFEVGAICHLYPCRRFIKNRTVFSVCYGLLLALINYEIQVSQTGKTLGFFLPYLGLLTLAFFIDMDYISFLAVALLLPTVSVQIAFLIRPIADIWEGAAVSWVVMLLPRVSLLPLYLYLKRFMIPGEETIPGGYSVPSILLSVCGIGLIYFGSDRGNDITVVLWIVNLMLCVLTLLLYYNYYCIAREYMEKMNLQMRKKHLEDMMWYVKDIGTLYDDLRKLKHDNKNHFLILSNLLEEHEYDKALDYFRTLEQKQESIELFVGSENAAVNAILNAKRTLALKWKIEMDLQIMLPSSVVMNDVDLCALLGNLIDNALEACRGNEGAQITVQIRQKQAYLLFDVKNTVQHGVLLRNPNLETTKSEKEFHGYGIRIVRDLVAKYKGNVSFQEQNGVFLAQVSIPNVISD